MTDCYFIKIFNEEALTCQELILHEDTVSLVVDLSLFPSILLAWGFKVNSNVWNVVKMGAYIKPVNQVVRLAQPWHPGARNIAVK